MKFPRPPLFFAIVALATAIAAFAQAQIGPPSDSPPPAQPSPPSSPGSAVPRGGAVGPGPAQSGAGIPRIDVLEVMARTALMSLNDANLTGNYAVLHARLHPEFQTQMPPDKLAGIFAPFRTAKVDYAPMLVHAITYTDGPRIDADGNLVTKGYMETRPWRTNFDLAWRQSAGKWLLWKISVDVRAPQ